MNKFSLLTVISIAAMLSGCVAQPKHARVDQLDTQAKIDEMVRKAEAGDVEAQVQACSASTDGKLYKPADGGDGWCEKSAAHGSIHAMSEMSARYDIGYNRPVDYKKALYWLTRAGNAPVRKDELMDEVVATQVYEKLAEVYEFGMMGAMPNQKTAAKWRLKAAKSFDPTSFVPLARMYESGTGVKQDYKQAAVWYRNAGRIGYWDGAHGLALLYVKGLGMPRDMVEAYYWETLSFRLRGKDDALPADGIYIDLIASDVLTPDQLVDVEERVSNWKPDYSGF